jgi:hypothetical protein
METGLWIGNDPTLRGFMTKGLGIPADLPSLGTAYQLPLRFGKGATSRLLSFVLKVCSTLEV